MDDETLARLLQAEEEENVRSLRNGAKSTQSASDDFDPFDPFPDLHKLFRAFNDQYFSGMLGSVAVEWSKKMTLCAGKCYYNVGGYCVIRLSEPLLKFRSREDYINTLLHEMIHALLFITHSNQDHDGHGPDFLAHAERINQIAGTNITVYHSFHDEVDHHRTHVWFCSGPCQNMPPYFGYVRRAMNRPPQPADKWWAEHQQQCGGTFKKVSEPEKQKEKLEGNPVILETFFKKSGGKRKLIENVESEHRKSQRTDGDLITMVQEDKAGKMVTTYEKKESDMKNAARMRILPELSTIQQAEAPTLGHKLVQCPLCQDMVVEKEANAHVNACLAKAGYDN